VNCHDVDLGRYRSSRRRRDALAKIGFHLWRRHASAGRAELRDLPL